MIPKSFHELKDLWFYETTICVNFPIENNAAFANTYIWHASKLKEGLISTRRNDPKKHNDPKKQLQNTETFSLENMIPAFSPTLYNYFLPS